MRSFRDALERLVNVVVEQGRDWKLIDALLRTIIGFVIEKDGQVLAPDAMPSSAPGDVSAELGGDVRSPPPGQPRLLPEFRLRIEAVRDSWSDDETAAYLLIGLRQVRRRAQAGHLYYFLVNRKRRYPIWQFDGHFGVLSGVRDVGRALPAHWSPAQVYQFMTNRRAELNSMTPAQWLLAKRDTRRITALVAERAEGL